MEKEIDYLRKQLEQVKLETEQQLERQRQELEQQLERERQELEQQLERERQESERQRQELEQQLERQRDANEQLITQLQEQTQGNLTPEVIIKSLNTDAPSSIADVCKRNAVRNISTKLNKNRIYITHRCSHEQQIPVELIQPEFGVFKQFCESADQQTTHQVFRDEHQQSSLIRNTTKFVRKMNKFYDNEKMRVEMLLRILKKIFTDKVTWNEDAEDFPSIGVFSRENSRPDFCALPDADSSSYPECRFVPALICEVKNELGTTKFNPIFEAAGYYAKSYSRVFSSQNARVDPSVLVVIAGTYLHILGAVTVLLPSLDDGSSDDQQQTHEVAHFVDSLINPIDTSCTSISLNSYLSGVFVGLRDLVKSILTSNRLPFRPYFLSPPWMLSRTPIKFTTLCKISGKLVWYQPSPNPVVWKCATRYSKDAHDTAFKCGIAPQLYSEQDLAGGWKLVIMEYFEGVMVDQVDDNNRGDQWKTHKEQFFAGVRKFHEQGFVHGDLRSSNVLYSQDFGFRIIDFDWAGFSKSVTYPANMNHIDIDWPEGAGPKACITTAHDMYWLTKITD